MAWFRCKGLDRETGDRRSRTYWADDENSAIDKASEDGVLVEAITPLPTPPPNERSVRHFFTKVVGTTYKNADGSSRQEIIDMLLTGEKLELENEDDNPVDPNAVAVHSECGQVGYLSRSLAEQVLQGSDQGKRYMVFVKEITGEPPRHGVNLLVIVAEPEATREFISSRMKPICDEALPGYRIELD